MNMSDSPIIRHDPSYYSQQRLEGRVADLETQLRRQRRARRYRKKVVKKQQRAKHELSRRQNRKNNGRR
jgi:hypothetical protein